MSHRVVVPPDVQKAIAHFHPLLKHRIRSALDEMAQDPYQGKPLKEDLQGLYSYRVYHHCIVYKIVFHRIEVHVVGIGHRKTVYQIRH